MLGPLGRAPPQRVHTWKAVSRSTRDGDPVPRVSTDLSQGRGREAKWEEKVGNAEPPQQGLGRWAPLFSSFDGQQATTSHSPGLSPSTLIWTFRCNGLCKALSPSRMWPAVGRNVLIIDAPQPRSHLFNPSDVPLDICRWLAFGLIARRAADEARHARCRRLEYLRHYHK
ncbi:hypothetical protein GQ53DRAFT_182629 [Thozetella sp. PMI_491]|nr:hypothetical protein GQ53DRAFT_182629 [Thozetella sp. PMI_491]